MLYRNSSDAADDMDGMLAFLNKTELESILPDRCEEVISKLRESGFLWRLAPKVRKGHVKFVVSKCVSTKNDDVSHFAAFFQSDFLVAFKTSGSERLAKFRFGFNYHYH
jgi:hypothetical protein